jgi:hypothetical protein
MAVCDDMCDCMLSACRGKVLYGSSLWSSGHKDGFDEGGFDDYAAGMLGISASEEAEGESFRRAAVGQGVGMWTGMQCFQGRFACIDRPLLYGCVSAETLLVLSSR